MEKLCATWNSTSMSLHKFDVSKADKTKPERVLNSKEHTQFPGGVGSLGWFVDHCCPQLSFQLAELCRKQASPTVARFGETQQSDPHCEGD